MTINISYTGGTITAPIAAALDTYAQERSGAAVTHRLISGKQAVTLREANQRTGELTLLYSNIATARTVANQFAAPAIYTYTDTDPVESLNFIAENITVEFNGEARSALVKIKFSEVST